MSDQATAEAAETITNPPPSEAAFSSPEQAPERDYEAEARAQGWVPEAEFRGSKRPAKFLPAKEFVERGEEIRPFLDSRTKRLHAELSKKQQEFEQRTERLEKAYQANAAATERRHKEELARVKNEQRRAAEAGDMQEFDRLDTVKANLELTAPKAEAAPVVDPQADLAKRQAKWRADNPWFDNDWKLQQETIAYSNWYGERHQELSFEENMAATTAYLRQEYPQKFGGSKPVANGHSAVDGGSSFPGAGKRGGPEDGASAAELRQADADIAAGLYKDRKSWFAVYKR